MDEQTLDPDSDPVWQGRVEGTGSGRPWVQEDVVEVIVASSSHHGWGRPAGGIEDGEVPWSRPSAPCVVQRSWGGCYNRSRFQRNG
jgi:hypothetical protein